MLQIVSWSTIWIKKIINAYIPKVIGRERERERERETTSNARPSVVTRDGRATFGVQKVYPIDYD